MTVIRTLFMLACLLCHPALAAEDGPGTWQIARNLTVTEIAAGVWMHTTVHTLDDGQVFPANGLLVRDGEALIMVDTAWSPGETRALLDWARDEIGLPVSLAVVTHFHDDSMIGRGVLAAAGIPVYSHPLTPGLAGNTELPPPAILPALGQTGSSLRFGPVELYYPGPGHSEDNLAVWVEHAHVLFGSCSVRTPEFPGRGNTADADLGLWPVAMQNLLDNYPAAEIVVPGHGKPGDRSLLVHTRQLFQP